MRMYLGDILQYITAKNINTLSTFTADAYSHFHSCIYEHICNAHNLQSYETVTVRNINIGEESIKLSYATMESYSALRQRP